MKFFHFFLKLPLEPSLYDIANRLRLVVCVDTVIYYECLQACLYKVFGTSPIHLLLECCQLLASLTLNPLLLVSSELPRLDFGLYLGLVVGFGLFNFLH